MNIRSTIIGSTMLVVLLTAGAAQSLSGSNTVTSDDIVDGTITTPDLKAGSISGSRLLDNGITGAKVYPNTLSGADVNEGSLVLTCPSDMSSVGDLCLGAERGPASQTAAMSDCADHGLRLPSLAEGRIIVELASITLIWTDAAFQNGSTYMGMVTGVNTWAAYPSSDEIKYRCVTTVGARP